MRRLIFIFFVAVDGIFSRPGSGEVLQVEYTGFSVWLDCERRGAYSKPGGASPLCYARDVSDEMVERYRRRL
jgi:hypothetical protein